MQNTDVDEIGPCMRDAASRARVSEVVVGANVGKDWVREGIGINSAWTWLLDDEYMRTIILVSVRMVECCCE